MPAVLAAAALLFVFAAVPQVMAQVTVQYYALPSGAHPHDVAPATDGGVWYTAQHQEALGRLDPATGAVEHIHLGDGARPHGVIVGPDGAPWVTEGPDSGAFAGALV